MARSKAVFYPSKEFSVVIPGEGMVTILFPESGIMYFDIHTHQYSQRRENIISVYNLDISGCVSCCGLDLQHTDYSLGIHPWNIREDRWTRDLDFIEKNIVFRNVRMIGECGLDHLCNTPAGLQQKVFLAQIHISEKHNKPLIIHCVKAFDELLALKHEIKPQQVWIIHGFRGKPQQAAQLLKNGFYLSFGPRHNKESLKTVPLDRLFLETDDGAMNIESVFQSAAETLGVKLEDLKNQLIRNSIESGIITTDPCLSE